MTYWEKIELLSKKIANLKTLNYGWDGYYAKSFRTEDLEKAKKCLAMIVSRFANLSVEDIFIAPCSDRSIDFEFTYDDFEFLINSKEK